VDTETPRPEKLLIDYDTTVNSAPTDISGQGNHGRFNGTAQYSPANKAFKFDGTNDYIQTGNGIVSGNPPMSQSIWFNYTGASLETLYSITAGYGTNNVFWVYVSGDVLGVDFSANTVSFTDPNTGSSAIGPDQWYHLVITYDGNSTIGGRRCYINGVEQVSSAVSGSSANGTLSLGSARVTLGALDFSTTHAMVGLLSNFKLYDTILEPSEVQKLYQLGRTGRSMVISDTAVGIGKVPEAQLDVRGSGGFTGDLTVGGNMNNHQYWFWGGRNSQNTNGSTAGSNIVIAYDHRAGYTSAWSTNTWTCPVDGAWMVMGNFMAYPHSNQGYFWIEVRRYGNDGSTLISGGDANDMHTPYRDSAYSSWHFKQSHYCKRGEKLQVWYRGSGTNAYMQLHSHWGNINIFKIG
jgi:hypothetical protein